MARLITALLLLSCGQRVEPRACVTPCGIIVPSSQFYCEDFKLLERDLASRLAPTLPRACEAWRGVTAWEHDGASSVLDGRAVAGWAECHLSRFHFHMGFEAWRRPWHTAFGHELIHIAQGCNAPTPPDGTQGAHADWTFRGYYQLLSEMTETLDKGEAP